MLQISGVSRHGRTRGFEVVATSSLSKSSAWKSAVIVALLALVAAGVVMAFHNMPVFSRHPAP
jgi:hypothetical protein